MHSDTSESGDSSATDFLDQFLVLFEIGLCLLLGVVVVVVLLGYDQASEGHE